MPVKYIRPAACFLAAKRKRNIVIEPIQAEQFAVWLKTRSKEQRAMLTETGFKAQPGQLHALSGKSGTVEKILVGVPKTPGLYDFADVARKITHLFSEQVINKASFSLAIKGDYTMACAGWGLFCQALDLYKKHASPMPCLVLPAAIDKKRLAATVESLCLIRDLVNIPSNDMGPAELERAARELAGGFQASIKIIGDKTLARDFPLVFAVGDSSPRRPRLIEMIWGNPKHPKVTLVGKGVCFDTGGLDIKPSVHMAHMKKDMGGAAHALGVARMVMGMKLPVRLRVLIPAVENAISGTSFRPGDIFKSRKGLTVENTNTDAEGRLILADALTYACEDKPDLVIDFATLTGSARAALGASIPAMFCTDDKLAEEMKKISFRESDPVWPMPLYAPYEKLIESGIADLVNSAALPGDLIYSALFLQRFLLPGTTWMHLDIFAWENAGRAGRPKGGADTGARAVYALLEKKYGGGVARK